MSEIDFSKLDSKDENINSLILQAKHKRTNQAERFIQQGEDTTLPKQRKKKERTKKNVGFTIDIDVCNKFDEYCINNEKNKSLIVNNLIKDYLKKHLDSD